MKYAFALLVALAGFVSSVAWAQEGAVIESGGRQAPSSVICAGVTSDAQV